jgi:Putative Actinobacterial Holin-X, holin superfamily III
MNGFISRLIGDATAPLRETSTRLLRKAVLFFLAISFLFVASIFLTIALFVFLQTLAGSVGAALSIGGLYLAAGVIGIFVAMRERPVRADRPSAALREKNTVPMEETETPRQGKADFANTIDDSIAPFLDILKEAGMERERLALDAGAEIAKQLHPFSLVAFAMISGFILGTIMRRSEPPRA